MPFTTQKGKKKPPPRPPPPNFSKYKSRSTLNLNQQNQSVNLIEWSPPSSPKPERSRHYGGSVSSSFSSSTSSLASSKKSFESDGLPPVTNSMWPVQPQPLALSPTFQSYLPTVSNQASTNIGSTVAHNLNVPQFRPTIIRPKVKVNSRNDNLSTPSGSPPMPNIPPPSPPKGILNVETPYGIALFNYSPSHSSDLNFQEGDVVVLMHRINDDWLYGKVIDKEGMFPESFIDVQVPLKEEQNLVTALYDFPAQMPGDLSLKQANGNRQFAAKLSVSPCSGGDSSLTLLKLKKLQKTLQNVPKN